MQQGIRSVMPQGQMPGQAPMQTQPMPGMMPSQSGPQPGLTAFVPSLTGLEIPQMLQLFGDPNSPIPKNRILAAIVEKQKQMAARQSVQNQMAMQQNSGQQGTIADAVVAQAAPVQAAHGGEMHGYAGGGAVAFRNGGDPEEEKLRQQIRDMFGSAASPLNILGPRAGQERERAQEILRMLPMLDKEQMRNILGQTSRIVEPAAYQEFGPGERMEQLAPAISRPPGRGMAAERQAQQPAPRTTFDITDPGSISALRIAAQDMSLPETERADLQRRIAMMEGGVRSALSGTPVAAPSRPTTATPADLPPEMQKIYADREAEMRRRLTRPESLVAAEQGLAALAKSNIEAQQAEAKAYSDEIRAARDAAMARASRGVFDDPRALLGLAGMIDTRKGQGMGSFARGLSGIMGQKETAAETARKEFALAQRDERAMQANIRQTQMLEAQRQVALEKGKLDEVNAINDKLAELGMEREKFRLTRGDKALDQALEGRKVAATERQAAATEANVNKPSATAQLMRELGLPPTIESVRQLTEAQYGPRTEGRTKLTYDQAADNVGKFMDSLAGMQEIAVIKRQAKESGQPEPSMSQIREMLIQRELQGGGGRPATPAPTGSATLPPGFKLDK